MLSVNFLPFPVIETERMILRKMMHSDKNEILFLRSDPRTMQFLDREPLKNEEEALGLIQKILDALDKNEGISWGIELKGNSRLVGTIGYWRMEKENFRAEIGYMIEPDLQGKGYMQEAITAVIDHGFNVLNLHSIEANVNPLNKASIRLLERNGFVREAYHRENYYYNGKFLDSAIYSLISEK
jgi:ribosomal-protein-alanine N-acetyltransferase